jgi:glycosyltransferase involved in cell wall biosynthesis
MRIALVARGCRPGAGIELYTYELARRLALRHTVSVITRPEAFRECGARLEPFRVRSRPKWLSILTFSRHAGALARAGKYDLVHAQGSDCTWGDVVTAHSCHAAGMAASLRLHPGPVNRLHKVLSPAHRAIVQLEKQTFACAPQVLAVSHQVARQLQHFYALPAEKVQTVYPGVDSRMYDLQQLKPLRAGLRQALDLQSHEVLFLLVANDPRLKGAEQILRALALAGQSAGHLLIASNRTAHPELQRLADRLGLSARVHTLAAGAGALQAFAAADVYLALPEYESFGLTILEAMACSLPVITTENAGATEIMLTGREGILLPDQPEARAVAQAMQQLAQDAGLRQRLGAAGRRTAEQFTWDKMAGEIEKVYENVLAKHGR